MAKEPEQISDVTTERTYLAITTTGLIVWLAVWWLTTYALATLAATVGPEWSAGAVLGASIVCGLPATCEGLHAVDRVAVVRLGLEDRR